MRRILLQLVHPAFERSRANRALFDAASRQDGVTVNDLYERYPDLAIDVRREQRLLEEHDAVVFLHPLYWYSSPALLKEWQDLVLEYGWAYGEGGTALAGKLWLSAITAGGGKDAYCAEGYNRFPIRTLLTPFEQTARLCGMRFLAPFVVFGTIRLTRPADLSPHAARFAELVGELRDGTADLNALEAAEYASTDARAEGAR